MEDLIDKYSKVIDEAASLFSRFPKQSYDKKLFSEWSLEDLIAHFNHWAVHELHEIQAIINETPRIWIESIDTYNTEGVNQRKLMSFEELLAEFNQVNKIIIDRYRDVPPERWAIKMYKGKRYDLRWFINISIKHYLDEHFPEMTTALKRT